MRLAGRVPSPPPLTAMQPLDWLCLAAVIAVATAMRLVFYTGFFGSDEVVYVQTAAHIASGDWQASDYIGATRYGMNLPVALAIHLGGLSETSANLWPFLCSIGEVALVFVIARWLWNTRAAVLSAGLLALLPLHVHFAGRMMADPPLALFLTLSVALLLRLSQSGSLWTALAAGLAWGGVFWVKESVALLYVPIFFILGLYLFRFNGRWRWIVTGIGLALAANCGLMAYVAGNPFHVFAVMKGAVAKVIGLPLHTSPGFYLRYLFLDIRHTFLLGYLAAAAMLLYGVQFFRTRQTAPGTQFVFLWVVLLVGMFSLAVVSFSPIKLVMKQTNYMLIFSGPLALLAGWFLASLPSRIFAPVATLAVSGSVLLAALEQQAVTVFTANSKAAYAFLRHHPSLYLLGTTNNERAVLFYALMQDRTDLHDRAQSLGEMPTSPASPDTPTNWAAQAAAGNVYAVLDLQNVDWGRSPGSIRRLADVPACWVPVATLTPDNLGSGHWMVQGLFNLGALLPAGLQRTYNTALQPVTRPAPAYLFRVASLCTPLTRSLTGGNSSR